MGGVADLSRRQQFCGQLRRTDDDVFGTQMEMLLGCWAPGEVTSGCGTGCT